MEIRKDIQGFEGKYQVSNIGRIKSLPNEKRKGIRTMNPGGNGRYKIAGFCVNKTHTGKLIHRLVAQAFLPNPSNKPYINHKNGDGLDNRVENLERCTQSENITHAYRVLKRTPPTGGKKRYSSLNHASKKVNQYTLDGNFIKARDCMVDAMKAIGVTSGNIGKCCTGERPTAGGYKWSFNNNE